MHYKSNQVAYVSGTTLAFRCVLSRRSTFVRSPPRARAHVHAVLPPPRVGRFEKLDITPKSAQKIKPVLERWMAEAEERHKNGVDNLTDFIGGEPSKKRKRRTSFTPQALEVLNEHFERNTHPSGEWGGVRRRAVGLRSKREDVADVR